MENLKQPKPTQDKKQSDQSSHNAEPEKQPTSLNPPAIQRQRELQETVSGFEDHRATQLKGIIDNSPRLKKGAAIQNMINKSPVVQKAGLKQAAITQSPLMAAQRKRQEELFGTERERVTESGTVQRVKQEEEDLTKEGNNIQLKSTAESREKPQNTTGMPDALKTGVEDLSGMSMDDVKVHYNSDKPESLQAHAYAQGTDIHIAPGQEKHLPHEAWHIVQQKQGKVQPTMQMKGAQINDDEGLEKEADDMGAKAMQMKADEEANPGEKVRPSGTDSGSNPIQLARLNLRKDGTISGVSNFPDRPASNLRGTQGQHLTAYVVFEDMIRSRVKDRTVTEAAGELIKVLNEIAALPGMQLRSAGYLVPHIARLKTTLQDNDDDASVIGDTIDTILSIRNQVPGTAERGTGGGHGESKHSGILETVESALRTDSWKDSWDEDVVSEQCRYAVWRLLDYNPSNPASDEDRNKIATVIITHFKSIVSAYPKVDEWLNEREDYYTTYLKANRDGVEMPLKNIKPVQLDNIFELVRAAM